MADRTGQQFGNYQLRNLLGQGGFADVYLGEHIHLGTKAAVKVLHTQLAGDDVTGFRNEARTIAQLEHPHIVRVLEFGLEGTVPFLVMSYAPNGSLRQLHPQGTVLPLTTALAYLKQIVEALQYAHDQKIIHCDIKPENILLGRHNELLLSDFGVALVAQSTKMQSIQEIIGTAAYIAPEMLQGHPQAASDQYALGIMTYEWLSGERPFHGSFTALISQHMLVPPPPLRGTNPLISPMSSKSCRPLWPKSPRNALHRSEPSLRRSNRQPRWQGMKQRKRHCLPLFQKQRKCIQPVCRSLRLPALLHRWHGPWRRGQRQSSARQQRTRQRPQCHTCSR